MDTMALSHNEIFDKVQDVLVDALGVDDEDVTPSATLRGDLGAESIDFLDIVFRLEKAFGIKIPRGELFPEQLDPAFVVDNKLNDAGMAEVKRRMPNADLSELEQTRDVALIANLFSVQDIVAYLEKKTAA